MRIGITTDLRYSIFSSGNANACLSVAEIFKGFDDDHELIFLHQEEGRTWWDDVKSLKDNMPRCILVSDFLKDSEPLDLLIEIGFFASPLMRPRLARVCIWYNRKPGLFTDLEASVYGSRTGTGRDLEGISAIFTADCFTTKEDLIYMQTLYPSIPIHIVPFIWSPVIVEHHRKELQSPVWLNNYQATSNNTPWSIHIMETNNTNTSSCTLPLTIIKHAIESRLFPLSNLYIHNSDLLKKNAFFNDNILQHTKVVDISYNLVGRQRCIDWVYDPKSIVLSHSRFINIKIANLEAAWVGIPVIHNNEMLRDLGHGLEKLYYKSNSITGAADAIHKAVFETSSIPYLNSLDSLTELRTTIMSRFYPGVHIEPWRKAVSLVSQTETSNKLRKFSILFTDMWSMFNEAHNTFTLAMENAMPEVKINGYSVNTLPSGEEPDLVIFGPFGSAHRRLPESWPKVHFTGEQTKPVKGSSIKLNIGFDITSDPSYLRMPLWMFYIDWFGADLEKIQNPLPLPIDTCTKVNPGEYLTRKKFCAFVVSNPANKIRNSAFLSLNSYKPVDSAGQLYNNIGDQIFAGQGGGGGELKKHAFLKDYRFCITYENRSNPGYTSEKILHAKAAGCIPIYWGDPSVGNDFDERGFINANNFKSERELIESVDKLNVNEDLWNQCASVPALSSEKCDLVRRTFSEMVSRFLQVSGKTYNIPEMIGAKTSAEADFLRNARNIPKNEIPKDDIPKDEIIPINDIIQASPGVPNDIILVTGATQRFWPYVITWLDSIKSHKLSVTGLSARVYVGADVSDAALQRTSETYSFAEFIRFPTETPLGFSDFWDPKHYAWKLWIYNTVVNDPLLKGRLVFYMDCASILVRWPLQWIQQAIANGVSFLDDTSQINKSWCHSKFCQALKVTEEELAENQIAACLIMFVAGHPLAMDLFSSAHLWARVRDVMVGEKWEGRDSSGKPYGHRHDQSVLSILGQRRNINRVPIDTVYCDKSARMTFHSGKSVYVHRGNYKTHEPYLPGIDEIFAINLDRRADRRKTFIEHHPDLKGILRRLPAYDGRALNLGPYLARMFKPNDFHWKKAVMGCALSHMKLLNMLVNEPSDINAYCILEDDCRLEKGWQAKWVKIYPDLPDDWDCVYLGGVLPPNKPGLSTVLERVAPGLARIAPNQFFGQAKPTRYFHFCTYAYVISRAGAKKILQSIFEKDGYWTSADHIMCNPVDRMNNYLMDPLVAGAFQDDDPIYQSADFNNFSRVDNFDSDLWNNDDRFSADEVISQYLVPLDISRTLQEADGNIIQVNKKPLLRFVSLDVCKISDGLYEGPWLQELFQDIKVSIEPVSANDPLDDRELIVLIRKPMWSEQLQWLDKLTNKGRTFKIIHLSDEFLNDPIHFYNWPNVTAVLRNYHRDDLPENPKILVIPLGYHWPAASIKKNFMEREYMWSFAGTNWANRQSEMAPLNDIQPNKALWYSNWRDPQNLGENEYMALLANTKCVPCPRGNNVETYRFYEALESGCIPVFIDYPDTAKWMQQFNMGDKSMNFYRLTDWTMAAAFINAVQEDQLTITEYRTMILTAWNLFKDSLKKKIKDLMT